MSHSPPETPGPADAPPPGRRPLVERLGLAVVALVIAALFAMMAVAFWVGGEGFLTVMAGLGVLMTLWAGVITVLRG